jgi:hypothetical protein
MLLRDVFEGRILSNHIWPPWSSNPTSPDYHLWGAMKDTVCRENPHVLLELKEAITNFSRNIPAIELSHVVANKIRCVDMCLQAYGGDFQHSL